MAKNDFFPVVYGILSKLYNCLKNDEKIPDDLFNKDIWNIKERFFNYIIKFLIDEKYITGIYYKLYDNKINFLAANDAEITPIGIEYLQDNSMMNKTKLFLQDIKASIPFM